MSIRPKDPQAAIKRARERHAASVRRWQERQREQARQRIANGEDVGLSRAAPIKPVNRERKAKRAEEGRVYGPYHKWISSQPCLVQSEDCWGSVTGHHLKTVGAGGEDLGNQIPLCARHHTEVHTMGEERFEVKYRVLLRCRASILKDQYTLEMAS